MQMRDYTGPAAKISAVRPERRNISNWIQRRDEVVDAAAKLFAAKGYHATSVAELGDAVGVARGNLYYYIQSKDTLLSLIHDRVMAEVLSAGTAAHAMETTATERLSFLGRELVRIIIDYPDHVWVFLHEFRNLHGQAATDFRRQRREFEQRLEEILIDGCNAGEFDIVDTRLAALGWLGLHNYIYIWHHSGSPFTADVIADQFGRIFLGGILKD